MSHCIAPNSRVERLLRLALPMVPGRGTCSYAQRVRARRRNPGPLPMQSSIGGLLQHRITALILTIAACVLSNTCNHALCSDDNRVPNIVLIMADDLGWGDTGFNGNKTIRTPNLDAMAADGLRLTRFYAAAPVCSPTRGSCLTGRHPYRYGIFTANAGHMRPQELTLAELLKKHGYATGHFGKWHLGTLTKQLVESNRGGPRGAKHFSPPWQNGFDTCFSTEAKVPTWDPMWRPKGNRSGTWWDPVENAADATEYGTHYWSDGQLVKDNLRGDDSRVIMDRAIPFIRDAASRGKPFFAVIWFHTPHLPVVAGPKYTAMYSQHEKYQQHYFGCITAMDEQIGRLRDELDKLDVKQDTLITFCSDNGPEGNESAPGSAGGLRGRKRSLFEGGIRVPAVIVWPQRIRARSEADLPACTSDYLPTIVELLGAKPSDDRPMDGVSLLPLFDGKLKERPRPIGFQSGNQLALIDNHWKLIRIGGKRKGKAEGEFMLFHLENDPGEKTDVADRHSEMVKRMSTELDQWQKSCAASLAGEDYD